MVGESLLEGGFFQGVMNKFSAGGGGAPIPLNKQSPVICRQGDLNSSHAGNIWGKINHLNKRLKKNCLKLISTPWSNYDQPLKFLLILVICYIFMR